MGVHDGWTPCWPVHDIHILLYQKSSRVTCCVGRGIVLDIHKVLSVVPSPREAHTITDKPDVTLMVVSSIQHHQFTPPTMVAGTPYHDWGATVTVHGLDTLIYQSLLPCGAHEHGHHCETAWTETITEDTVPPMHEVPPSVPFSSHTAASHVIQSQSGIPGRMPRPIARSLFTMFRTDKLLRNRRIISEMKRFSLSIRINCLSSRVVVRLLRPPRRRWCGRTPSRLRRKILLTHNSDTPNIIVTSCRE